MKPTVGRIVHYVLDSNDGCKTPVGEYRAAMIVRVWTEECVNLLLFTDGYNDRGDGKDTVRITSVTQDEDEKKGRTWHWPERDA